MQHCTYCYKQNYHCNKHNKVDTKYKIANIVEHRQYIIAANSKPTNNKRCRREEEEKVKKTHLHFITTI